MNLFWIGAAVTFVLAGITESSSLMLLFLSLLGAAILMSLKQSGKKKAK